MTGESAAPLSGSPRRVSRRAVQSSSSRSMPQEWAPSRPTPGLGAAHPVEVAVGFVSALRRAGLDVSLTSALLYAEALSVCDVSSRSPVYWAGRASLVHRLEDVAVHDAVFGAYWLGSPLGTTGPVPAVSVPVVLETDADDADPGAEDEERPRGDVITVRYSATETLAAKDFADYTDAELEEARRLMERLRWHGPTRPSRRSEPSRSCRGRPDVRRTVRAAMRAGGEPMRMHRRVSGRRPRRLVMLLDVSGSMERYARALLRLLHAAVAGRSRVEAFALGTRLTRLTRELSSRDPDRAMRAASAAVADWSGGTRLGAGLRAFNDEWGCRGMARGSLVVILSDGWDRGDPAEMSEQMQRLARVAHRVVWVNPLKASPGYAPLARGMAAALPHVDDFVEGHNLESLERLAELVLSDSGRSVRHSGASRNPPVGVAAARAITGALDGGAGGAAPSRERRQP